MSAQSRLNVSKALVAGSWVPGDVSVDSDGCVVDVGLTPSDAKTSRVAVPGFVDLQVNGFVGVDARHADAGGFEAMAVAMAASGVVAFQPTIYSSTVDVYVDALRTIGALAKTSAGARVLPAHLEGPFLSEVWAGAHERHRFLLPNRGVLQRLLASGPVGMMTLAPELPGALDIVRDLSAAGVIASMGHSDAPADTARRAINCGVSIMTHGFNAHRRFRPRDPGLMGVALTDPRCSVSIICDLQHLAPETVAIVAAVAGDRMMLVTDSIAPAGTDASSWTIEGVNVFIADGRAQLADGTIAGGVVPMDQCVRNLSSIGLELSAAIRSASTTPARLVGLGPWDLTPGSATVPIVLDDRLEVASVA